MTIRLVVNYKMQSICVYMQFKQINRFSTTGPQIFFPLQYSLFPTPPASNSPYNSSSQTG
jgi:hypothetical protein